MFRRTDPQGTFDSLNVLLSPQKIARLEKKHWAGGFRRKALPVLLTNEETFRPLFCQDNGRPNKPVASTLGLLILKEMFDLTDEAALDNFEFNNAWQYALNVDPENAHLCQKTLHNFRVKMGEAEEEGILTYSALFDEIVGAIIRDKGLKIGKQRLDSTHIRSNMAVLTRLGLFTHTITAFIKKLHKQHPRLFEALPKGIRERYIDREGYFADSPSSDGRRRLSFPTRTRKSFLRHNLLDRIGYCVLAQYFSFLGLPEFLLFPLVQFALHGAPFFYLDVERLLVFKIYSQPVTLRRERPEKHGHRNRRYQHEKKMAEDFLHDLFEPAVAPLCKRALSPLTPI